MQLEAQGYVLVERPLASSRGGQAVGAAALVGSAVDVVLTPRACLCIMDDSKLPQVSKNLPVMGIPVMQYWFEQRQRRVRRSGEMLTSVSGRHGMPAMHSECMMWVLTPRAHLCMDHG